MHLVVVCISMTGELFSCHHFESTVWKSGYRLLCGARQ